MGLSLKRRDSCDYLKDTYGGILNILMHEQNINKAIQFLDQSLENLISGNVSMDKLAITRALRSHYKNPGQIAHSVLANRIGKRDPGNKPKSGDRIKYLFITHPNNNVILGEKIETPEFILENKLEIDYMYYITNQLMKPLQQLFGLSIEHIWRELGKGSAILTFKKDMAKLKAETDDLEEFMKKKEKYCSLKIKILLFDKFLTKIFNSRNKIQTIDCIFKKK
jgi:DNA polymerase elongation subunit (family B)